jgi:hypothetical protein
MLVGTRILRAKKCGLVNGKLTDLLIPQIIEESSAFFHMRRLASQIETQLKEQGVCAVYNSELERVWPKTISSERRKKQIKRFADAHQLEVTFYDVGLCAVFERPYGKSREHDSILPSALAKPAKSQRKRRSN